MEIAKRSVGKEGVRSYREPISFWYVFIPSEVDREKYIANCKRTQTITVINDNAEINNKVKIGKLALQKVRFPQNQKELGSPVLVANILSKSQLVILDVFDYGDAFDELKEHESALIERTEKGLAEIRVQGDTGEIFITVDAEDESGGALKVNVSNSKGSAQLGVNVDGTFTIITSQEVSVISNKSIDASIRDEKGESLSSISLTADGIVQMKSSKNLLFGEGKEALVLGDSLATLLKKLINEISVAANGGGPLANATAIAAYSLQVDEVLSKYSKTD